jgi:fructose-bisphosphate aldolase, class I
LKTWKGQDVNIPAAQKVLLARAEANSLAQQGKYTGGIGGDAANASTFVKGYVY